MKFVRSKKVPPREREVIGVESGARIQLGKSGESGAAQYLLQLGYELLECNHRSKTGQADLILRDGDTLVFCEVKTRSSEVTGHAGESYRPKQQARLRKLILRYLQKSGWQGPLRVDLLALQKEQQSPHYQVYHYKDAISLEDSW